MSTTEGYGKQVDSGMIVFQRNNIGLTSMKGEPCTYHAKRNENLLLLIIYVDDILVASTDLKWIDEVKMSLQKQFEIKDLELAEYCLGLEIIQGENFVRVTQIRYILDILEKYGMGQCNPVTTPAELQVKNPEKSNNEARNENWPYRELIEALMYLVVGARLDLANTVSRLPQFTNEPTHLHWAAAKRVLRNLAGAKDLGLVYTKTDQPVFDYADADWGSCIDTRSFTSYTFILGGNNLEVAKQRTVALSSTEVEYVGLSEATKEALYLCSMLQEIGREVSSVRL